MTDNSEIRFLGDMQRLEMKPGDVLVLTLEQSISADVAERLRAMVAGSLSGAKVLVLADGIKLGAVGVESDRQPHEVYSRHNVEPGSQVFDVEFDLELTEVQEVDVTAGELTCYFKPLAMDKDGNARTRKLRYRTIHPIYGGGSKPCLFHCYGRL
jgi:hypothetical protein